MILATTGQVWSLSLTESAIYPLAICPLATARGGAAARRFRGAAARSLCVTALLAVLFLPEAAHATSGQGMVVMGRWKAMDNCTIAAQRAFPDFTAESNAKRDAKLKECLAGANLPPRETASPAR
jgi:hypothetical protein